MSKVLINEEHLISIGNALREVLETQNRYLPSQMAKAILSLKAKKNYVKFSDDPFTVTIAGITINKVEQHLEFSGTSAGFWEKMPFETPVVFKANTEYNWYLTDVNDEPKKTKATVYMFLASATGHLQSYQLTGTTGTKTFSFSADTEITGIFLSIPSKTVINEGFKFVIEEKD